MTAPVTFSTARLLDPASFLDISFHLARFTAIEISLSNGNSLRAEPMGDKRLDFCTVDIDGKCIRQDWGGFQPLALTLAMAFVG